MPVIAPKRSKIENNKSELDVEIRTKPRHLFAAVSESRSLGWIVELS